MATSKIVESFSEVFPQEAVADIPVRFCTQYQRVRVCSARGSKFEPIYSALYNDDGVLVLEQVGEKNVYDEIQSHKDSVDINVLLKRFSMGETDVFDKVQGFYSDTSDMPETYQEILNSVITSEQFFDSLPVDVKKKFNNSFSEFMVSLGRENFLDNFKDDSASVDSSAVSESEVSEDE